MVAPGSRVIGRTVEQAAIHRDTDTVVLGVERRSRMPRMQLADIRLEAGDVLLVGGTRDAIEGLRTNRDLILLEWSAAELPQRRYARRAQVIFALLVLYSASGIGPIVIGALAAALAMILSGCLNIRQAVRAFDRRIYLMIGAALAAATALQATGGAGLVAEGTIALTNGQPNWVDPVGALPGGERAHQHPVQQRHRGAVHAGRARHRQHRSAPSRCPSWWR